MLKNQQIGFFEDDSFFGKKTIVLEKVNLLIFDHF